MTNRLLTSVSLVLLVLHTATATPDVSRPNILMILVDDLGYSDLSPYGGEIDTPNLQRLAAEGTQFSNFHTAMKCNPTRATLMTGLDNNLAAEGPRREYHLRSQVPTIAQRLSAHGYYTVMAGKWDLGGAAGQTPSERGFQRSFALLPGVSTHYPNVLGAGTTEGGYTAGYRADGKPVKLPADFYSTTFYTQQLLAYLDSRPEEGKPFFAYLALTAPHYPLQAPSSAVQRFRGRYDAGFQAIRAQRLKRQVALGLVSPDQTPWPAPALPEWWALSPEERAYEARRMEVYAAMVWVVDQQVGLILEYLKAQSLEQETLVIFASDNGADGSTRGAGYDTRYNNSTDNLGSASSFVTQGINWARVSSTPFRLVKSFPTEGGTRVPLLARWPGKIPTGKTNDAWFRVADLPWTFLQVAGIDVHGDPALGTLSGRSALTTLTGGQSPYLASEAVIHSYVEKRLGGANVLLDRWKLVWWKEQGRYLSPQLFDLSTDPMEVQDIADSHPDVVRQVTASWQAYRRRAGSGVDEIAAGLDANN